MCTQLGKKKIPGGGTIDSLFKRPLTLHTSLPKERPVCRAADHRCCLLYISS